MSKRVTARLAAAVALSGCSLAFAAGPASTNFSLPTSTLNAGVGGMTSTNFRLSSSLSGGFATAPGASANFRITHGLRTAVGAAPSLASAASRRVHGGAGTFDLPLSIVPPPATNHAPTTEPRRGPNHTVVFTFDKPVAAATVTIDEGVATAGAPTFVGNEVAVALTGVTNAQYVTVSLSGIVAVDGSNGGSVRARIGFLAGDVNQNRVVSVSDLAQINAQLARALTGVNFLKDVNASGAISVADKAITNGLLTKALPAP